MGKIIPKKSFGNLSQQKNESKSKKIQFSLKLTKKLLLPINIGNE